MLSRCARLQCEVRDSSVLLRVYQVSTPAALYLMSDVCARCQEVSSRPGFRKGIRPRSVPDSEYVIVQHRML